MHSADSDLRRKKCIPCGRIGAPLTREQAAVALEGCAGWELVEKDGSLHMKKIFSFPDFAGSIRCVNAVAELAEAENHHPNISIAYNRVTLTLWTHAVGGLSENDFIMAAKINEKMSGVR